MSTGEKPTLTRDDWSRVVSYDSATGKFAWLIRPSIGVAVGDVAGSATVQGYVHIRYKGHAYKAHRVAWLMVHGREPQGFIDHVNGDKADNRIANLREASPSQNNMNKVGWNEIGLKGVWQASKSTFAAGVQVDGKSIYLGAFRTAELAAAAYRSAAQRLHGEFARDV
jgi:hypothetical protein